MTTRAARALRGVSFATLAVLLAAAAHTLGGGGAPSPLFCAVATVLATPGAVLLAGARMSGARTFAAVAASQLVFHVAFAVTGDLGRWTPSSGHVHGAALELAAGAPAGAVPAGMLLAHAAAALVTAGAVCRGERVIARVWGGVRARLRRLRIPLPAAPRPVPLLVPSSSVVVRRPRAAAQPLTRRGPPVPFPA